MWYRWNLFNGENHQLSADSIGVIKSPNEGVRELALQKLRGKQRQNTDGEKIFTTHTSARELVFRLCEGLLQLSNKTIK